MRVLEGPGQVQTPVPAQGVHRQASCPTPGCCCGLRTTIHGWSPAAPSWAHSKDARQPRLLGRHRPPGSSEPRSGQAGSSASRAQAARVRVGARPAGLLPAPRPRARQALRPVQAQEWPPPLQASPRREAPRRQLVRPPKAAVRGVARAAARPLARAQPAARSLRAPLPQPPVQQARAPRAQKPQPVRSARRRRIPDPVPPQVPGARSVQRAPPRPPAPQPPGSARSWE